MILCSPILACPRSFSWENSNGYFKFEPSWTKVQWFDPSLEIEVIILCLLFFDLRFLPCLWIGHSDP